MYVKCYNGGIQSIFSNTFSKKILTPIGGIKKSSLYEVTTKRRIREWVGVSYGKGESEPNLSQLLKLQLNILQVLHIF